MTLIKHVSKNKFGNDVSISCVSESFVPGKYKQNKKVQNVERVKYCTADISQEEMVAEAQNMGGIIQTTLY